MNQHTQLQMAQAIRAVDALNAKGCTITRVTIDGAMPLIEIDRPPVDEPAMVIAIRSSGGFPRTVWVTEWRGCRIEAPAKHPAANRSRPAMPVYPKEVA